MLLFTIIPAKAIIPTPHITTTKTCWIRKKTKNTHVVDKNTAVITINVWYTLLNCVTNTNIISVIANIKAFNKNVPDFFDLLCRL